MGRYQVWFGGLFIMIIVIGCSLGERSRKLKQLDHDLTGEGLDNKQLGHDLTGEGLDNKQLGQDLDLDNEDLDHNLDLDDELQDLDDEEYVENLSIEELEAEIEQLEQELLEAGLTLEEIYDDEDIEEEDEGLLAEELSGAYNQEIIPDLTISRYAREAAAYSSKAGTQGKKNKKKGLKGTRKGAKQTKSSTNKSKMKKGKGVKKGKRGKKGKGVKKGKRGKKGKGVKKGKRGKKGNKRTKKGKKNRKKVKKGKKMKKGKKKGKKGKNQTKGKKKKKLFKKKKMNNRNKKKKPSKNRQGCSAGQVDAQIFTDMVTCLEYERNQIFNFDQQFQRVKAQSKTCKLKFSKVESFLTPATYLANAIGINGSDQSRAQCGDGITSVGGGLITSAKQEVDTALSIYNYLMECPEWVAASCVSEDVYNDTAKVKFDECDVEFKKIKAKNAECKDLVEQGEVGTCWADQFAAIQTVKKLGCTPFSKDVSDRMGVRKSRCLKAGFADEESNTKNPEFAGFTGFVACKKAEDEAVFHSSVCNHGTVKTMDEIAKEGTELASKLVEAKEALRTRMGEEYKKMMEKSDARTDRGLDKYDDEDEDDMGDVDEIEDDMEDN